MKQCPTIVMNPRRACWAGSAEVATPATNHYYYYYHYYVLEMQPPDGLVRVSICGRPSVPDEQILLWEQKVTPERSQRPFRSIVGKVISEVILEKIPECDSGTFCWGAPTPPPER